MPDVNPPAAYEQDEGRLDAPRPARSHRVLWIILPILLILATAGGVSWWFMGRTQQQAAAPPPMKVPVMTVVGQTVPIYRSFPGTTQALRTVPIQARVTGYLVEQGAVDGADVAAGALLYRIDPKDYQAAFAQAQASLAQANASLQVLARQPGTQPDPGPSRLGLTGYVRPGQQHLSPGPGELGQQRGRRE